MADPVSLAITVALDLASMAMTASKKIEGPRLSDLKVSTADYGTPLIQFYGTKRIECICIYAEDIREKKTEQKTKGGKYTEYSYFGTWASLIADNPTDSVLRVYADRHLIYDATGKSGAVIPLTETMGFSMNLKIGPNFRVYYGSETQAPDPRLLAKITAKEGPGTCPAYLGISYMVFEDIPLEKLGNHVPQISCEAARATTPSYPYMQAATDKSNTAMFASGGSWMTIAQNAVASSIEWWDLTTFTRVAVSTGSNATAGTVVNVGMANDGTAYFFGQYIIFPSVGGRLWVVPPAGAPSYIEGTASAWFSGPTRVIDADDGIRYVYTGTNHGFAADGYLDYGILVSTPPLGNAVDFCKGPGGMPFGLFEKPSSDTFTIYDIVNETASVITGAVMRGAGAPAADICYVESLNQFCVFSDGHFYAVDATTFTIKNQRAGSWDTLNLPRTALGLSDTFWSGFAEISLADGSTVQTVDPSVWLLENTGSAKFYDRVNNGIITLPQFEAHITDRLLGRVQGSGWTLGDICADVAQKCGMLPPEFDFADLDQNIPGFAWTQGPGASIVGPLLELHDSDVRPHGFIQQGLKRGQPLVGDVISPEWMVKDSSGGQLYTIPITAETDLPLRIFATFADPSMDEQPNTASAQRNAASVATTREQAFDLTTLNETPATIQPLIERVLRRYWVGSTKPAFLLTPLEIRLEPGDVRMLELEDGEFLRCRATKAAIKANRAIETEWEVDGETQVNVPDWQLDNASPLSIVYSTPGGFTYGRPQDQVPVPIPTKGFVIDTPLLADSQDQAVPVLYDAAGPYAASAFWPGAVVWQADSTGPDALFSGGWDLFASTEGSTWGNASTLPDAASDVIDEATVLTVQLIGGGSLSSITNDQMLADQSLNLALVGDELIQFRDADEIATDQYELTGLIRGARNSEYAISGHQAGETFLLIGANVHKRTMGAGEIGDTRYYKFASYDLNLDGLIATAVDFQANANRPPAPAHLALRRDPVTGDWAITWVRRSRIGGGSVNGQDVPLGETSEAYRVKIMNGSTVVATYNVTSPSLEYLNAEQVGDWGSAQTSLTVEVCQMSPALSLEGFVSSASG